MKVVVDLDCEHEVDALGDFMLSLNPEYFNKATVNGELGWEAYQRLKKNCVTLVFVTNPNNNVEKVLEFKDIIQRQKFSIKKESITIGIIDNTLPKYVEYNLYLGKQKLMTSECYGEIAELVENWIIEPVQKRLTIVVRTNEGIETPPIKFRDTQTKDHLYLLKIELPDENIPFVWEILTDPLETILTKKNYSIVDIHDVRRGMMFVGWFDCSSIKKCLKPLTEASKV